MVKKILVALDYSLPSRRAAMYVSGIAPFLPDCHVALFAILTGVPGNAEALGELTGPENVELHGAEDHEQELAQVENLLAETARIFAERQFPAERLTIAAKPLRRGIAQDLLDEARSCGCDTIVVGKRSLSKMKQMVLGSVSRELLKKAEDLAIWVV